MRQIIENNEKMATEYEEVQGSYKDLKIKFELLKKDNLEDLKSLQNNLLQGEMKTCKKLQ